MIFAFTASYLYWLLLPTSLYLVYRAQVAANKETDGWEAPYTLPLPRPPQPPTPPKERDC